MTNRTGNSSTASGSKGLKRGKLENMKLVRGGEFLMGSEQYYDDEKPVRLATVGDFWIDETPVTNAQFARFVAATGYVTFAEHAPNPLDYPGLLPEMAHAGSIVFSPPEGPVDLNGPPVWWQFVPGASWHAPTGPGSSTDGFEDHPVVHIAAIDAEAYARWAGKTLPSEAEWEYAARGGLSGKEFAWGDELEPDGVPQAKTFQGTFPSDNRAPKGLERTAPVRSYPANPFGLYDMIGNVWEWTADWYSKTTVDAGPACCGPSRHRAARLDESIDPCTPHVAIPRRVLKGGSHMCAPNYCKRYRPASRWAQPVDTTTTHVGFRCIVRR